jgi:predicted  nucleic acid-binding Zn-ribbon protein
VREKLELLRELQELDGDLNARRRERAQMALELAEIDEEVARVQEMVDKLDAGVATLSGQRSDLSHDLVLEEGNVSRAEGRLPTIKTQREYVAVLKEIDTAKKMNKDIQDKIAALETELAAVNRDRDEKVAEMAAIKERVASRQEEIATAIGTCDQVLGAGDSRRDEFLAKLPTRMRKRYEMLLDRRAGVAIVEARQGVCTGCNMNLPPQLFNSLFTTKEILDCPHCNRMLYLAESC